ncbi:hypothetical protein EVAR_44750_1 [Eumeta japonica]|uniref:Uncharacterized protein n=1 Tax=Eumeta variegata TaxID=151549 RepID=A0A4C1XHD9_EUMVA|nr:hypothetical protein EVAR_44750_1 [Eumeta japonica]
MNVDRSERRPPPGGRGVGAATLVSVSRRRAGQKLLMFTTQRKPTAVVSERDVFMVIRCKWYVSGRHRGGRGHFLPRLIIRASGPRGQR